MAPVLSSLNIERDIRWYDEKVGFKYCTKQDGYAVLTRENQWIHLQLNHNSDEDPIHGSVIKIFVDDIQSIFKEMNDRGVVTRDKLRLYTPWNTNEFGFYDLNNNAIFFVADIT